MSARHTPKITTDGAPSSDLSAAKQREYMRAFRAHRVAARQCIQCAGTIYTAGSWSCEDCKAASREHGARVYAAKVARGECPDCGDNVVGTAYHHCAACRELRRLREKERAA